MLQAAGVELTACRKGETMAYKKYKISNVNTGEVLRGEATELAERVGLTVKGFYNAYYCQVRAKGVWEIELIEKAEKETSKNYSNEQLEMWDAVTAKLRRSGCNLRIPIVPVNSERRAMKAIM